MTNLNEFNLNDLLFLKKKYNTPIWVYNSEIIKKKIKLLKRFDIIRFAQKSCSNINILKIMLNCGVKIDAVSLGEIERALIAGFKTKNNDIVFTSDLFDELTLEKIVKLKLIVNIGSIDMLTQLGCLSYGHSIWLRINPGFGHGHSRKTNTGGENSKHGIWYNDLPVAFELISKYNFDLLGFHMHIGSGVNYKHLNKVSDAMVAQVIKFNKDIKYISAGGGLSIPYKKNEQEIDTLHYYNVWDKARNKISKHLGHKVMLEIEPGRFLVAESGILISQIRAIKKMGSKNFILVDAGFNDLMRPTMYGSYHHISLLPYNNRKINHNNKINYIVAGPLCESGDVFTQSKDGRTSNRLLPVSIQVGDYLIFHNTGAYGSSMSSNYNTRPLIPEILFENGQFKEIRRSQTIQDLISLENY